MKHEEFSTELRLTSRRRRPGMLRDLPAMDRVAGLGIRGQGPSPGASARGCYAG